MKRCFLLFLVMAVGSVVSIETGLRNLGIVLALVSAVPAGIAFEIVTRPKELR